MKIRTITTGITLSSSSEEDKIKQAAEFNQKTKTVFEKAGYEVQTTRVATNSWEEYVKDIEEIFKIQKLCDEFDISFFNIGPAVTPEKIQLLPDIIKGSSTISCSAKIDDRGNVPFAAQVTKQIAEETENGYGNFRYCASCNCKPGIPFFPAGYHGGETSFGIGLECGDLAMKAFTGASSLEDAEKRLKVVFEEECAKVEALAKDMGVSYNGIDVSLNPGLEESESIALAYEKIGLGKFGEPGTLAISAMVTGVLKNLSVKTCGYSGLMLPVGEDVGLAKRANEGGYNLNNLLLYSAVCGCGFDTVPIPGDISASKIESILLDVAALATKLDKPLSCRLFPFPGKKAGEMTTFDSPYLVNCKVLEV